MDPYKAGPMISLSLQDYSDLVKQFPGSAKNQDGSLRSAHVPIAAHFGFTVETKKDFVTLTFTNEHDAEAFHQCYKSVCKLVLRGLPQESTEKYPAATRAAWQNDSTDDENCQHRLNYPSAQRHQRIAEFSDHRLRQASFNDYEDKPQCCRFVYDASKCSVGETTTSKYLLSFLRQLVNKKSVKCVLYPIKDTDILLDLGSHECAVVTVTSQDVKELLMSKLQDRGDHVCELPQQTLGHVSVTVRADNVYKVAERSKKPVDTGLQSWRKNFDLDIVRNGNVDYTCEGYWLNVHQFNVHMQREMLKCRKKRISDISRQSQQWDARDADEQTKDPTESHHIDDVKEVEPQDGKEYSSEKKNKRKEREKEVDAIEHSSVQRLDDKDTRSGRTEEQEQNDDQESQQSKRDQVHTSSLWVELNSSQELQEPEACDMNRVESAQMRARQKTSPQMGARPKMSHGNSDTKMQRQLSQQYSECIDCSAIVFKFLTEHPKLREDIESKYSVIVSNKKDGPGFVVAGEINEKVNKASKRLAEVVQKMKNDQIASKTIHKNFKRDILLRVEKEITDDSVSWLLDDTNNEIKCVGDHAEEIVNKINAFIYEAGYVTEFYIELDTFKYMGACGGFTDFETDVKINIQPNPTDAFALAVISGKNKKDVTEVETHINQRISRINQDLRREEIQLSPQAERPSEYIRDLQRRYPKVYVDVEKDGVLVIIGPKQLAYRVKKEIPHHLYQQVSQTTQGKSQWYDTESAGATKGYSDEGSQYSKQKMPNRPNVHKVTYKSTTGNLKVHVLVQDITTMSVDIIVNAANGRLQHGGGVAGAIAKAAGKELVKDCDDFIKQQGGPIQVSKHYMSKPGKLNCKKVMHVVGPMLRKDDFANTMNDLKNAIRNCLRSANTPGFSSIAIPPISAGIFGIPPAHVAMVLAQCVGDFATTSKDHLTNIYIVDISDETINIVQKQLDQLTCLTKQADHIGATAGTSLSSTEANKRSDSKGKSNDKRGTEIEDGSDSDFEEIGMPVDDLKLVTDHFEEKTQTESTIQKPKTRQLCDSDAEGEERMDTGENESKDAAEESYPQEDCPICMCLIDDPEVLSKCKHKFCKDCIKQCFEKSKPVCPICGVVYGKITGNQPHSGRMTHHTEKRIRLPGYEAHGSIVIEYSFPPGIQTEEHPHPGQPYSGTGRTAFLPDNTEGRKVLNLLKQAFAARLTFTIGTSVTSGVENTVTWNDIHHKTNPTGGPQRFGYPDPTYLSRVTEELASKGITF